MTRLRTASLLALVALGAAPTNGNAQNGARDVVLEEKSSLLTTGIRVRVRTAREQVLTGTLVGQKADSMLVRAGWAADTTFVSLSDVTELEVSRGRARPHLMRNTTLGVVAGMGLGWVAGRNTYTDRYYGSGATPSRIDRSWDGATIGGLIGGAVGALTSLRPVERWQRVRLARGAPTITVSPWRGSITLSL